jgi:XTP/dITP diphosphohydrolase
MEFILATSNKHKALEFAELFDPKKITIVPAQNSIEVDETGISYFENALLKAKAYYDQFKAPVLADDSGLAVINLPGELGIYSARFGGPGLSDKERALLLLQTLAEKNISDREAYFTCVLCFYLSPTEIFYFEGRMAGKIGHSYLGENGFGYDPIFIPIDSKEGRVVSELPDWKKDNSHRAFAVKQALKFFQEK